jgi:chemotaxis response regulator CheB
VLAQDEATSVVWGMPGAVIQAGLANKVLPLSELATEINSVVHTESQRAAVNFAGGFSPRPFSAKVS